MEATIADEGHKKLKRFIEEVGSYMTEDARTLVIISDLIEKANFEMMVRDCKLLPRVISEGHDEYEQYFVYMLKRS